MNPPLSTAQTTDAPPSSNRPVIRKNGIKIILLILTAIFAALTTYFATRESYYFEVKIKTNETLSPFLRCDSGTEIVEQGAISGTINTSRTYENGFHKLSFRLTAEPISSLSFFLGASSYNASVKDAKLTKKTFWGLRDVKLANVDISQANFVKGDKTKKCKWNANSALLEISNAKSANNLPIQIKLEKKFENFEKTSIVGKIIAFSVFLLLQWILLVLFLFLSPRLISKGVGLLRFLYEKYLYLKTNLSNLTKRRPQINPVVLSLLCALLVSFFFLQKTRFIEIESSVGDVRTIDLTSSANNAKDGVSRLPVLKIGVNSSFELQRFKLFSDNDITIKIHALQDVKIKNIKVFNKIGILPFHYDSFLLCPAKKGCGFELNLSGVVF